jgi:hypothetical protein
LAPANDPSWKTCQGQECHLPHFVAAIHLSKTSANTDNCPQNLLRACQTEVVNDQGRYHALIVQSSRLPTESEDVLTLLADV